MVLPLVRLHPRGRPWCSDRRENCSAHPVRSVFAARRFVTRGIGMGGPAKPALWNLAFDCVVRCVGDLSNVAAPIHIDDLAALAASAAAL